MQSRIGQIIGSLYIRLRKGIETFKGVDFIESVGVNEIEINKEIGNRYDISNIKVLDQILKQCDITQEDVFADFGCGKGAVLALAAKYPFCKVVGIEISKVLVDIAINNLSKMHIDRAEIICKDAREYDDIDKITYFYFFNPFPESVFKVVMKNIKESYLRNKRRIVIIYYNPVCDNVIIDTGIFIKTDEVYKKNMCASIYIYSVQNTYNNIKL